jgi:short-subunit dehydrogenase
VTPRPLTVLITGCSTGIGRALALEFHRRGHRVIATARKTSSLDALQREGLLTQVLDVDSSESIDALCRRLDAEAITLDLLVNNAGYGLMGPLLDVALADVRRQFETNVISVLAMVQRLFPHLAQPGARIVNLGSVSGALVTPFSGAYCATKAAVHALSDAMRMELKPFGIDVVTVLPGAIRSEFGATASRSAAVQDTQGSRYAAIADAIAARAGASQQHATDTAVFARSLVDTLAATRVSARVPLGSGSFALPFLARWVPLRWRDHLLSRRFKLDRLR